MGWDDLPEHINEPHEWNGKDDDDHWYTAWRKYVKGYFCFKFGRLPRVVFAARGAGRWRLEDDTFSGGLDAGVLVNRKFGGGWYLSRVQYWTNWHLALQWPLFLHGHYGKWQFYVGFKRDADKVYWLALYAGRVWK